MSKFALNLDPDGRILSATCDRFAPKGQPRIDYLPEGDISDYRYEKDKYIHDPPEKKEEKSKLALEARVAALEEALYEFLMNANAYRQALYPSDRTEAIK